MASRCAATFGVLADARSRQRRRRARLAGAALLAIVLVCVLARATAGSGSGRPGAPAGADAATPGRSLDLRLSAGRATRTFRIAAAAGRAYDVSVAAPVASAVVLSMDIGPGAGWTLAARDDAGCSTNAGRTACLAHFAAGGNPGGTWRLVVTKAAGPAADVRIAITFSRGAGG
jgi:hypothetical protein